MSAYKEPNIEIVMTHDAVLNDATGKWQPTIKIGIYASWTHGYPVAATTIYHPNGFDNYFEADAFAKQFIEDTDV